MCFKINQKLLVIYLFTFVCVSPLGVIVKALDCDLNVSEFELQSFFYVHFRTNTLEKSMNLLIPAVSDKIVLLLFSFKDGFDIK